jgi:REP element-mobilizing transposase RayT
MARPLRVEFAGAVYHVTARGNTQQPIWLDDADRRLFLKTLAEVVDRYAWLCHAYCLMPNHYHLLVETPRANLSLGARHLNGVYAQAFNRRHARVGHLFQGRYQGILVQREAHLLEVCRYVVLNPVRANLCTRPEDWPWSSFGATAGYLPAPGFLTVEWILGQFGEDRLRARKRYRAFVSEPASVGPSSTPQGGLYLGDDDFVRRHAPAGEECREIPRVQRQPLRPALEELLRDDRAGAIAAAHREYGYRLCEIAGYLGVHPATVGRRLRRLEVPASPGMFDCKT